MKMTRWLLLLLTGFHSASGILERLRQNACMCQANERRQVSFNGRPDRSTTACPLFCRNVMLSGKGGGDFLLADATATLDTPGLSATRAAKKPYNGSSVNAASPGDRHSDLTAESASVTCRQKMPTFSSRRRPCQPLTIRCPAVLQTMAWRNRHGACTVQTLFTKNPPYSRLRPCPTRQERQRLWSRVDSVIMDSSGSSSSVDPVLPFH
ncbi:hypothetical protein T06_14377 [Trichinella sp. T6]|nr:hypothetical protein T06_14377 [Trichinella sp. T6]